jgi:metalloprotein, YbeY family
MVKEPELIAYYTDEDVEAPRLRERILRNWIREVAALYNRRVGELCYQFCGDERILQTNQDFLDHDYYTDIITFDESEGDVISGDMLISLETVRSNAELLGNEYAEELHRVIIHGVLHLCGLKDKTPEDEANMRAAEDQALRLLHELLGEGVTLFD